MRRTGGITLTMRYSPYSRNEPELGPMIGFNRGSPGLLVFQAQVAGGVGGHGHGAPLSACMQSIPCCCMLYDMIQTI